MIFDSTLLAAVASEMRARLGRDPAAAVLRDIWQSEAATGDEEGGRALYLQFRDGTLLIDTHPQRSRLHFVREVPRPTNTPFTQTLRKALSNSQLVRMVQPGFDRVLRLEFASRSEVGENRRHILVAELMERRSNAILLGSDEVIIDAVKRLPPFLNRVRTVLPHRPYELPPSGKQNPLTVTDWEARVREAQQHSDFELLRWLRANFTGVSPLLARHIEREQQLNADAGEVCARVWEHVKLAAHGEFETTVCGNQPYPFAFVAGCEAAGGEICDALEECAAREEQRLWLEAERQSLLSHLQRRAKINVAQRDDIEKAKKHAAEAEKHLFLGNLLLMRSPQVEAALDAKVKSVTLHDEEEREYTIALESEWSVGDNAQRCFNRYRRALKMGGDAPEREKKLEAERQQLEGFIARAKSAESIGELQAIAHDCGWKREEKPRVLSRTRQLEAAARPENKLRRREIDGWTAFIGRSAEENQLLLSKIARPSDIWMHVRDAPSAHVIIKNQKGKTPPDKVLDEAARWLAHTARKGKSGDVLEIIYTPAKWVRAIKGAPGRVTLGRFQTRLVTT